MYVGPSRYGVSVVIMYFVMCCDSGQHNPQGSLTPPSISSAPSNMEMLEEHGRLPGRYFAAQAAVKALLHGRSKVGTNEFDVAIRDVTKILCRGVSDALRSRVLTLSIDQLYPLALQDDCESFVCGGCLLRGGRRVVTGPGFPEGIPLGDPNGRPIP